MQPYQRTQEKREKVAGATGLAVTLMVHGVALAICLTSGLTYLDPPPPERTSLLIEFEQEEEVAKPVQTSIGRQPQAEQVNREREVELVQKAESPYVSQKPNVTPASQPDPHGDVEVPTPKVEEEPKLDPRASFPGMSKTPNNATTPHSAQEAVRCGTLWQKKSHLC